VLELWLGISQQLTQHIDWLVICKTKKYISARDNQVLTANH